MTPVVFKKVVDRIFRRAGLDPSDSDITAPAFKALVEHINDRLYSAWFSWEWRFIELLEERAWRQHWRIDVAYSKGDEVFADADGNYYRCIQNAITGTLVTDTNYFLNITPLQDIYLAYEQPFETPIGQVVKIYKEDPRTSHHARTLDFQPSTKGIDISFNSCPGIPALVWVKFKIVPPVFTALPYIASKTYGIGDSVFNVDDGQCYLKISANGSTAPPAAAWDLIEFPERFQRYVTAGAYADMIRDMEKGVADPSPRLALAQASEAEAVQILLREIDIELAQGQKMYFSIRAPRHRRRHHGGTGGPAAAAPAPIPPLPGVIYRPDIVALRKATAEPSLDEIVTVGIALKTVVKIVIDPNYPGTQYQNQEYRLVQGAADPNDPGQVAPLDFNATTNNVHWERID